MLRSGRLPGTLFCDVLLRAFPQHHNPDRSPRELTETIATAELALLTFLRIIASTNRRETTEIPNRLPYRYLGSIINIDFNMLWSYIKRYLKRRRFCPPTPPPNPVATTGFNDGSEQQRAHPSAPHSRRNQRIVHQLLDERHSLSCAARRARWTQAGAPARTLRDERARSRSGAALQEVRDRRRRRAREVSSARRPVGIRRASAHGAGFLAPLSARRRPGKLRQR